MYFLLLKQEHKRGCVFSPSYFRLSYLFYDVAGIRSPGLDSILGGGLVTRFFPTNKQYSRPMLPGERGQPTMFTPWGKLLSPDDHADAQIHYSTATIASAFKSIVAQIIYDLLATIFYTIAAFPSLIVGIGFIGYSFRESKQNERQHLQEFAIETCFGNVLLCPYFALSIVGDFLRETLALVTRTYGYFAQNEEESSRINVAMG